jgi:hypothetical protein
VEIKGKDVGKNVGAGRKGVADVGLDIQRIAGFVCSLALAVAIGPVQARQAGLGDPNAKASLPREAQRTEQFILAGGPFTSSKLPAAKRRIAARGESSAAETAHGTRCLLSYPRPLQQLSSDREVNRRQRRIVV